MSNNAHELSNRLLNALDNNYNVVDMHTVNEIISILEKFNITKELLETTRLGKHVNELRRKTTDPTLARRAKVLVKRWRDLVIPSVTSPGNTGSNRSSAERAVRRLGGTPLTSPALSRQVVSPAVQSPRPPSRPAWGGYESDSQDVILVDEDPPPRPAPPAPSPLVNAHKPLTPPVKRPPSPEPLYDDKKAKRDKKPKKRRGHSRAGSPGAAGSPSVTGAPGAGAGAPWRDRNGTAERRRNGCRKSALDPYAALVNRMPKVGDKKVKTTKELLEQIQSRGARPASPASPHSPDVMLIEPDSFPVKVSSPLRNGGSTPPPAPPSPPPPLPPLEDEREYHECTCEPADGAGATDATGAAECPAARRTAVLPLHVHALHHAYIPGVNGTRAPALPHAHAVRHAADPSRPGLFAAVVPLYKYTDYADDYCAKNMARVPICAHLPWDEFAPEPPPLPPPRSPPPLRPYPIDEPVKDEPPDDDGTDEKPDVSSVKIEMDTVEESSIDPSERLEAPSPPPVDETVPKSEFVAEAVPAAAVAPEHRDHRTVERTKAELGGRALYSAAVRAAAAIPYDYAQIDAAPVVSRPERLAAALAACRDSPRDALGRPPRAAAFAEWHESARLGDLVALPYVVID